MYIISQFSKLSGLTIKALRYYDEQSILHPSYRDNENNYRYYTDSDLQTALFIKQLRTLGFSIMEIKEVIALAENANDLKMIIQEKIKRIEDDILAQEKTIRILKKELENDCKHQPIMNDYEIIKKEVDSIFVATIRFKGKYSELDNYVPMLYKAVKQNINGKHFNCYYDDSYKEDADIELCLPVKKEIISKVVVCKSLPKKRMLTTIHYGSYDTLCYAYKALFHYANKHDITTHSPSRELYIKHPGMIFKGNPDHYVTEIQIPF